MVLTSTSFSLMKEKQLIFKWFIFKLFKVFASKDLKRQVAVRRSGITSDERIKELTGAQEGPRGKSGT